MPIHLCGTLWNTAILSFVFPHGDFHSNPKRGHKFSMCSKRSPGIPWSVRGQELLLKEVFLPLLPHKGGWGLARHEKKNIFLNTARFEQKLFYPRKCANWDKSEFATKKHKMYLTTSMSKIRLPQICKGNNYIINKKILF